MTGPEELVWAAAFGAALVAGHDKHTASLRAQVAVQTLRELPTGSAGSRSAAERSVYEFRTGDGE